MDLTKILANKNRKVIISIAIVAIILILLLGMSLLSRLRNNQSETQTDQKASTTREVISIYSITPANNETNVLIDTSTSITFGQNIPTENLKFEFTPPLNFTTIKQTSNTFLLKNKENLKSNQKYQLKIKFISGNYIFEKILKNEYILNFTTGKETLSESMGRTLKD